MIFSSKFIGTNIQGGFFGGTHDLVHACKIWFMHARSLWRKSQWNDSIGFGTVVVARKVSDMHFGEVMEVPLHKSLRIKIRL